MTMVKMSSGVICQQNGNVQAPVPDAKVSWRYRECSNSGRPERLAIAHETRIKTICGIECVCEKARLLGGWEVVFMGLQVSLFLHSLDDAERAVSLLLDTYDITSKTVAEYGYYFLSDGGKKTVIKRSMNHKPKKLKVA